MSTRDEIPTDKPDQSAALKAPPWLLWAFGVAIVVASFVAYAPGLDNGFTNWDDNWLITENRHIRGLNWENAQYWFNPMAPREELGNEYLPVRDFSYAVNYALDGYNPRAWHATNLILHMLISLLVMLFAYRLTGRRWIGGVAGLLFAVHPVHVEAVSWLSSRKDLLATLFLMLSVNLYLAIRRPTGGKASESFIRRVRESRRLIYSIAVLCFVLALLSKMTAVVLPAILLLIELYRGPKLKSAGVAKRAALQAPFWGIAALFTAMASTIGSGLMREPYGADKFQSLLTATSAITRDFQVLLSGYPLHAAVDLPVQTGLTLPVISGLLILAVMLGGGLAAWRFGLKGWDTPKSMLIGIAGFSGMWFLVSLAPVSNFAVQIGTVFAERYLYIPSVGFCIAVAALLVLGIESARGRAGLRLTLAPALVALALALVGLGVWRTGQAADTWAGSIRLWTHALSHDPGNHIAHFNLGREYQERALIEPDEKRRDEMLDKADAQYREALENKARTYRYDPARVYGAMALNEVYRGEPEAALALIERAREHIDLPWRDRRARDDVEALLANPRGLALSALGRHDEAVAAFEEAIEKSDRYPGARVNLASELARVALSGDGIDEDKLNRAKRELAEYERRHGSTEQFIESKARLLLKEFETRLATSGQGGQADVPEDLRPLLDEARKLYRSLIALRERGVTPPPAMAATLIEAADAFGRGRAGDAAAERYLRRALKLKPDYLGLRYLLAQLLFERGDARREATELLEEELKRHPDYQPARSLKAAGYRQAAVDRAAALRKAWQPEYEAQYGDAEPTWQGLIVRLHDREEFARQLIAVIVLLREAIELDPDNDEIHNLIEGTGMELVEGMWFSREPALRAHAEELLRNAFNARPVDGRIAAYLTEFYLRLAEQLIAAPEDSISEKDRRDEMDNLLANMLTLSERARQILSRKLYRTGRRVEEGQTELKDSDGEDMQLSEEARRMAAGEFIRAATILDPENIEALDWLKQYYEEDGDYEQALETFGKLIDALKDRPELTHGVYLSLGQLQLDFGRQLIRSFRHHLKFDNDDKARELRNKAVATFRAALETAQTLLDRPQDPDKLNLPIRLNGIAAQRLAYLETARAYEYYTIALEGYARAPLDFETEIAEVRRKRVWFERDPYERLRTLKQIVEDSPAGTDMSDIKSDILNLERRIARMEGQSLLDEGRPLDALERIEPGMRAPTPEMYELRGRIYGALGEAEKGDRRDEYRVLAARDLVRGNDPEALLEGARLYWEDPALMYEDDRVSRSRVALARAEEFIQTALPAMEEDSAARRRYSTLLDEVYGVQSEMRNLGRRYVAAARVERKNSRLESALDYIERATSMLGDDVEALRLKGAILRELAARGGEDSRERGEQALAAYTEALRLDNLLTGQRLAVMDDLVRLLWFELNDKAVARDWLDRYRIAALNASDEYRELYLPKVEELSAAMRE